MAVATNSIGLITKYSPEYFDKVYKQEAVTSVFDANRESVKFTGAKTVKIGKLQLGGLGNYYRNNDQVPNVAGSQSFYGSAGFGYQRSQMNYAWEEFTLTQDRAAAFPIEYFDDEELDSFKGRPSDSYTPQEVEQFEEVMTTMQPREVAAWLRSLQRRAVNLPDDLKDEAMLLMEE